MIFEPKDFSKWSEADVREEILAPLLRQLGYGAGTANNIIREQSLRYDRVYLGRKNPIMVAAKVAVRTTLSAEALAKLQEKAQ